MDNNFLSALYGMVNEGGGAPTEELIKAMTAGDLSGSQYIDQTTGFQALKPLSLDPNIKNLEYDLKRLKLHTMIPSKRIFNTVHEYLQQVKYGTGQPNFMGEGERPENSDSTYRRKSVLTKYFGVGSKLTLQAELNKHVDGKDPYTRLVENKMIELMKFKNGQLFTGDSSKASQEFDGIDRQLLVGINEIYGDPSGKTAEQLYDTYFADPNVVNADGKIMNEFHIQDATDAVVNQRFGEASVIISNATVYKNFVTRFYGKQRILMGGSNGAITGGQAVNAVDTQFGKIPFATDIFFDRRDAITYNKSGVTISSKAPSAPTLTSIAAATDTKNNFGTAHDGGYFYLVCAKNAYGESAPLVMNTEALAIASTESADLQFADGGGSYPATSYVVYRTKPDVANRLTAKYYPMFTVNPTELAAGFDGATDTKVRDRNRFIAGTHSAIVLDPSVDIWEFVELMGMTKIEFALTTLAKEFAVINFGAFVAYQPGKIAIIRNIGDDDLSTYTV